MSLRRDALRNRELLVAAGRETFAELGADATLEEVARRAGVGIGTLYRRFPSRAALVEAIYEEHIAEVAAAAEDGAGAVNAWSGLVGFLECVLKLQAANHPLREVFLTQGGLEERIVEHRRRVGSQLNAMIARARDEGSLRDDFTLGDLTFALWSFAPLFEATATVSPDAWRRHLQIVLDGMRPEGATRQRVKPLSRPQVEAAADALRHRYHRRRAA